MDSKEINKKIADLVSALEGMKVVDMHSYYCNFGHRGYDRIKFTSTNPNHPYNAQVTMESPLVGSDVYRITLVNKQCGAIEIFEEVSTHHPILHFVLLGYFRESYKTGKGVMEFVNVSKLKGMMEIPLY